MFEKWIRKLMNDIEVSEDYDNPIELVKEDKVELYEELFDQVHIEKLG